MWTGKDHLFSDVLSIHKLVGYRLKKSIRTCSSNANITVWLRLIVLFNVETLVFEEMGPAFSNNAKCKRYEKLSLKKFISTFKLSSCLDTFIFLLNGTSPHKAKPVMYLLKRHFRSDRFMSRYFPSDMTSRSSNLITYNLYLSNYFKNIVIIDCKINWIEG